MSARLAAFAALEEGADEVLKRHTAERLAACSQQLAEVERSHAGVHLPGSQGGGDISWDVEFASEAVCADFRARATATPNGLLGALGPAFEDLVESIVQLDAAPIHPIAGHVGSPGLVGVKRTLWFRVHEETPAEGLAAFERDMLEMPAHVPAIRNWCFSRLDRSESLGSGRWTHLWEQEFETSTGLEMDYMLSPFHWGLIDGWFDAEHPHSIVDPWLAHLYCDARESVLSWSA